MLIYILTLIYTTGHFEMLEGKYTKEISNIRLKNLKEAFHIREAQATR